MEYIKSYCRPSASSKGKKTCDLSDRCGICHSDGPPYYSHWNGSFVWAMWLVLFFSENFRRFYLWGASPKRHLLIRIIMDLKQTQSCSALSIQNGGDYASGSASSTCRVVCPMRSCGHEQVFFRLSHPKNVLGFQIWGKGRGSLIRSLSFWYEPMLELSMPPLPYCPHHIQEDVGSNIGWAKCLDSEGVCQKDMSALRIIQR